MDILCLTRQCPKCGMSYEATLSPGQDPSTVRGRCTDCRDRGWYGFFMAPLYLCVMIYWHFHPPPRIQRLPRLPKPPRKRRDKDGQPSRWGE